MQKPKYGFPLILGTKLTHLSSALEWAIRNDHPLKLTNPSQSSGPAISGQNLAFRLNHVSLKAGSGAEVVLQADFILNSGTLQIAGHSVSAYSLRANVGVKMNGTKLHFDPAGGQVKLLANGSEYSILPALAADFGLAGTAVLDLGPFRLGRWQLRPLAPVIRAEGGNAFIGMDVNPGNANPAFRYKQGEKPQLDPSLFTNLPTDLVSTGWGYLVDSSLVVILIRELEIGMNSRKDMKDFKAKVTRFDSPAHISASGSGAITLTGRGWPIDGTHNFKFDAVIKIKLAHERIEAHWEVTKATATLGIDVTNRIPGNAKSGIVVAGLPVALGNAADDFGQLKISQLSGAKNALYCTGIAETLPVEAPSVSSKPSTTIFAKKGLASKFYLENESSSSGKRRAPLYFFANKIDPLNPNFISTSKAPLKILPGKQATCSINYSGSGTENASLRTITNDKILINKILGWEVEGIFLMPTQLTFTYRYHPKVYNSLYKKVKVTNTGKGPLFLNFEISPLTGFFSIYPYNQQMTLNPGETKVLEIAYNPGISAPGVVNNATLTTTTQSGLALRTNLTGRVIETPNGIGTFWTRELEYQAHLWEFRQYLNWVTAKDILEKEFKEHTPPPRPRPCPMPNPIDWAKYRLKDAPEAEGVRISRETAPMYVGVGDVGVAAIPEGVDAWPELNSTVDGKLNFQVERWVESQEYDLEMEGNIQAMTWMDDRLLVATELGTKVIRLSESGRPMKVAHWEVEGETTALAGYDAWVLRAVAGRLELGLTPEDGSLELLESRELDAPVTAIASLGEGYFALARDGEIWILHPQTEGLNPVKQLACPFQGTQIVPGLMHFQVIGEGLATYSWDNGEASLLATLITSQIQSTLQLGDTILARTIEEELVVIDLLGEQVSISGRIEDRESLENSALFTEAQAPGPGKGLLASKQGNVLQIRHLRARGVDNTLLEHRNLISEAPLSIS
ncbi:MAG TPA: hypothetical protein ENJ82_15305 [Bacteroidetes bacterium]|nr:hypothetical protein [Bacteroidota bacterium]